MINVDLEKVLPSEIDKLAVGLIKIDSEGKVLKYNQEESYFSGLPSDQVIGKNFFRDVAPCTNNFFFKDQFFRKVVNKKEHLTLEYVFSIRMKPTKVKITIRPDTFNSDQYYILIDQL